MRAGRWRAPLQGCKAPVHRELPVDLDMLIEPDLPLASNTRCDEIEGPLANVTP